MPTGYHCQFVLMANIESFMMLPTCENELHWFCILVTSRPGLWCSRLLRTPLSYLVATIHIFLATNFELYCPFYAICCLSVVVSERVAPFANDVTSYFDLFFPAGVITRVIKVG